MTAKEYLKQAYRLNENIESRKKELEHLKQLSFSVSGSDASDDKVSKSRNQDAAFVAIIEKICELEKVINSEIDEYVNLKRSIHNMIESIPNESEKLILRYRYINFYTWDQIADKMKYSVKQVQRIHCQALKIVKF